MTGPARGPVEGYVDLGDDHIHYFDEGTGAPVLLIHGAFGSGARILQTEFGRSLVRNRRVIAPDSLAHGCSGAPPDPRHYGPRRRAAHLAGVLDCLGIARAHVVGYSMGGWMASALATFYPDRIASLAIGGWDVVEGMYTPAAVWGLPEITYPILSAMIRRDRPELLAGLHPDREAGLAAAIDGMNDLAGLADGVAACPAPVALWVGQEDLYHEASRRFAEARGFSFISLPGDHMATLETHGAEASRRVGLFIDQTAVSPNPTHRANRG
ncbi:alpha/beta hydrolase family protein [Brevundimonas sp.]|uniref:alpha/beta fold hydrolase n=1 Tax=Brevundimonas sp. TaxID=1871086 RepID=UPI002489BA4A|nr:alpha/beta hydrolase family protein [Brevundimonas sp.]MDI1282261.1 alpha/beta hydrolase [Brevundimonas sp.]